MPEREGQIGQPPFGPRDHCVLLTPQTIEPTQSLMGLLVGEGLKPAVVDDSLAAISKVALLDRLESTRAAWGLQPTGRIVLIIDTPAACHETTNLLSAIGTYLPHVTVIEFEPSQSKQMRMTIAGRTGPDGSAFRVGPASDRGRADQLTDGDDPATASADKLPEAIGPGEKLRRPRLRLVDQDAGADTVSRPTETGREKPSPRITSRRDSSSDEPGDPDISVTREELDMLLGGDDDEDEEETRRGGRELPS